MSKYSVNFKSGLGPNPVFKGLFKVIKNGAVRWTIYAFNSNYGYILHQFRDKARYWSNFVIFHAPVRGGGGHRRNIVIPFGMGKLEWCAYPMVKKL